MRVWQAAGGWKQGFELTSLVHVFPFYCIFSALQSVLGTEEHVGNRGGNEVAVKAKLARGWALFALHARPWMCIAVAAAPGTEGCNHQVNHRIWGGTGVCTRKLIRGLTGMLRVLPRVQAALYPSEPVNLKINSRRSVLITAVLRTSDSVFLSEKAPHSLAQYGYYLPT